LRRIHEQRIDHVRAGCFQLIGFAHFVHIAEALCLRRTEALARKGVSMGKRS
jgi:hypothetical protein